MPTCLPSTAQLPPKRRQVIRLPKPPASEWPKAPRGAKRHKAGAGKGEDSCSEVEEDGGDSEGEGEGGEANADGTPKQMSAAHRTGLAKASSAIEWLMTALGVRSGGRGGGKRQQVGRGGVHMGPVECDRLKEVGRWPKFSMHRA